VSLPTRGEAGYCEPAAVHLSAMLQRPGGVAGDALVDVAPRAAVAGGAVGQTLQQVRKRPLLGGRCCNACSPGAFPGAADGNMGNG
jgi:hypothetical protein